MHVGRAAGRRIFDAPTRPPSGSGRGRIRDSQGSSSMSKPWEYQLRIYLDDELADVARRDPDNPAIKPLADILTKHHATMKCQYDAFADYVGEAERRGTENF